MTSPLDPIIDRAIADGKVAQPDGVSTEPADLTRDHPAWRDIELALDLLDGMGYPQVRTCIDELLAGTDITIDTRGEVAVFAFHPVYEELYISATTLPSLNRRLKPRNEVAEFEAACRLFGQIVTLAAALLHECKHRESGFSGLMLNGLTDFLNDGGDHEEGLAHTEEVVFWGKLLLEAKRRGIRCGFFKELVDGIQDNYEVAKEQKYGDLWVTLFKELLDDWRAEQERLWPGAESKRSELDEDGTVTRWHIVNPTAICQCDGDEEQELYSEDGFTAKEVFVQEGAGYRLDPPRALGDCRLVSVSVNGSALAPPSSGPILVTITRKTNIVCEYRCITDLEREAAEALADRLARAQDELNETIAQCESIEAELAECRRRCAALEAALRSAEAALATAQTQRDNASDAARAARAARDAAKSAVEELEQKAAQWDAMSPQERDAARRRGAETLTTTLAEISAKLTRNATKHQRRLRELNAEADAVRAAWGDAGPTDDDFALLEDIRRRKTLNDARYRRVRDDCEDQQDVARQTWRDVDARRRADRELPGLRAQLAAAEAALTIAEQRLTDAEGRLARADAAKAAAALSLAHCRDRCETLERAKERLHEEHARQQEAVDALRQQASATDVPNPRIRRDRLEQRLERAYVTRGRASDMLRHALSRAQLTGTRPGPADMEIGATFPTGVARQLWLSTEAAVANVDVASSNLRIAERSALFLEACVASLRDEQQSVP